MELTPIHIPGRRRSKGEVLLAKAARKQSTSLRQKKKKRQKAGVSNIEKELPLEILERIFWFSENVNFPRSSLRFGLLLSGRPTLRDTITCAFGPTWDAWYGAIHGKGEMYPGPVNDLPRHNQYAVKSYHGWRGDLDRFGGNSELQSAILEYSWCDIDLILEAREVWIRRHAQDRPPDSLRIYFKKPDSYTYDEGPEDDNAVLSDKDRFYRDYQDFHDQTLADTNRYIVPFGIGTRIGVHPGTRIPDALITGEGTWRAGSGPDPHKALLKLFWLVAFGARLQPDQTWELTVRGHRAAFDLPLDEYEEGSNTTTTTNSTKKPSSSSPPRKCDPSKINLIAARLLMMLYIYQDWPQFVRDQQMQDTESWYDEEMRRLRRTIHGEPWGVVVTKALRAMLPLNLPYTDDM